MSRIQQNASVPTTVSITSLAGEGSHLDKQTTGNQQIELTVTNDKLQILIITVTKI